MKYSTGKANIYLRMDF